MLSENICPLHISKITSQNVSKCNLFVFLTFDVCIFPENLSTCFCFFFFEHLHIRARVIWSQSQFDGTHQIINASSKQVDVVYKYSFMWVVQLLCLRSEFAGSFYIAQLFKLTINVESLRNLKKIKIFILFSLNEVHFCET